ncbi:DUF6082 family protein [Luedemannella helvata]|uniref:Uncharacterized protein n=1 Tax=Luedemannella helvata TaxID=349315 RepID=A0ABP4W2G9_9ACTN
MRTHPVPQRLRMAVLTTAILSVVATATALLALSPPMMRNLADTRSDWTLLADVGQTYQGVAAVLAGLAFCGVAMSLLLQWRQNRTAQIIATRERHQDLLRFALDNPRYLPLGFGDLDGDIDYGPWVYSHLLVSHWKLAWDLGQLSEDSVREHAHTLFLSPEPYAWWRAVGHKWASDDSRRNKRYTSMINEAFDLVTAHHAAQAPGSDAAGGGETSASDTRIPSKSS